RPGSPANDLPYRGSLSLGSSLRPRRNQKIGRIKLACLFAIQDFGDIEALPWLLRLRSDSPGRPRRVQQPLKSLKPKRGKYFSFSDF
ncbi:MAG TPA: hypothetical protein VH255_07975, partial [Verrucomicrobiae bacterium]|nr:hypothetical protein [Verrucomicrobiae bacterium]